MVNMQLQFYKLSHRSRKHIEIPKFVGPDLKGLFLEALYFF